MVLFTAGLTFLTTLCLHHLCPVESHYSWLYVLVTDTPTHGGYAPWREKRLRNMCTCCPCIDRAGRQRNKGKLYSPHCVVTTHNLVLPRHRGQRREWCTVLDPSFHRARTAVTDTVTAHNLHGENHSAYIIQAWLSNREREVPPDWGYLVENWTRWHWSNPRKRDATLLQEGSAGAALMVLSIFQVVVAAERWSKTCRRWLRAIPSLHPKVSSFLPQAEMRKARWVCGDGEEGEWTGGGMDWRGEKSATGKIID